MRVRGYKQMKIDSIDKRYNEHRGTLIKKYRSILGRYVFIIGENEKNSKVCFYSNFSFDNNHRKYFHLE